MNGYIFLILYCGISAISFLSIHHVTQKSDPNVSMIYTFLLTIFIFHIINIKYINSIYKACRDNLKVVLWINLSTAIVWIGTFWSLKFINPAIFVTIFYGSTPFVSAILQMWHEGEIKFNYLIFMLLITVFITMLTLLQWIYQPTENNYLLGIFLALLSGGTLSYYFKYSKDLSEKAHLLPTQVLAIRFFATILFGIILTLYQPIVFSLCQAKISSFCYSGVITDHVWQKYINGISLEYIVLLSIVSLVLPTYLLQTGLHKVGALKSAYVIPLTPIFTYILGLFYGFPFDFYILTVILLLSFTLIMAVKTRV